MSCRLRHAVAPVALLTISMPALAQPSAAFPPEQPQPPAEPRPNSPPQPAASAQAPASPQKGPAQQRLAYPQPRPLYSPPPAPSLHLVGFTSDVPHVRFAVEFDQNRRVLGWCTNSCWVRLWPGRYRVDVAASKDVLGGSRPFKVDGPVLVTVSPQSHRSPFWLGLGIGSAVLVIASPVAAMVWARNLSTTEQDPFPTGLLLLGFGFVAGVVLTPISWIKWTHSSRPDLTVERIGR